MSLFELFEVCCLAGNCIDCVTNRDQRLKLSQAHAGRVQNKLGATPVIIARDNAKMSTVSLTMDCYGHHQFATVFVKGSAT